MSNSYGSGAPDVCSIEFLNGLDDASAQRLVRMASSYEAQRIQRGFAKRTLKSRAQIVEARAEISVLQWIHRNFDAGVFPFALLSFLILAAIGAVAVINWQTHTLLSILGGAR